MTDIADRDFQIERGVVREAIVGCLDLTHAERIVGLAMLELVSRQRFRDQGLLIAWPSEDYLAATTGISARRVRSAREKLLKLGAVMVIHRGGGKPGSTTHYAFELGWATRVAAEAKARWREPADKERETQVSPLRAEGGQQRPPSWEPESEKRSSPEAEGGRQCPPWGDEISREGGRNQQGGGTLASPEPFDEPSEENPLMETSDARSAANAPSAHGDEASVYGDDALAEKASKRARQPEPLQEREHAAERQRVGKAADDLIAHLKAQRP